MGEIIMGKHRNLKHNKVKQPKKIYTSYGICKICGNAFKPEYYTSYNRFGRKIRIFIGVYCSCGREYKEQN